MYSKYGSGTTKSKLIKKYRYLFFWYLAYPAWRASSVFILGTAAEEDVANNLLTPPGSIPVSPLVRREKRFLRPSFW